MLSHVHVQVLHMAFGAHLSLGKATLNFGSINSVVSVRHFLAMYAVVFRVDLLSCCGEITSLGSLTSFSQQNGTLKIIDRKKHIFKLAQGEYIAPEKIENIYIRSDPVAQVYVHGDSLQVRRGHHNTPCCNMLVNS